MIKKAIIFLTTTLLFCSGLNTTFAKQENQYYQKLSQVQQKELSETSEKITKAINKILVPAFKLYTENQRTETILLLNTAILVKTSNTTDISTKALLEEIRLQILELENINYSETKKYEAKTIYNQAYNENYDADSISDILKNAKNAYVLVDPFEENVAENISKIKENNNEVGCYISIGTGEDWRDDFAELKPFLVQKQWGEWEGEYFVKNADDGVLDVMKKRIDNLAKFGCDWVEFDNMDWAFDDDYKEDYDVEVTKKEAINYYQDVCEYANSKNIKCMAKNTVLEAEIFDGVLYESYSDEKNWWDTAGTKNFLEAGKLVIINHYDEKNPDKIYEFYKNYYNENISYIAESTEKEAYIHY